MRNQRRTLGTQIRMKKLEERIRVLEEKIGKLQVTIGKRRTKDELVHLNLYCLQNTSILPFALKELMLI